MENVNKKKHVVQINTFDPDYFKVGKAYHVTEGDKQYNMLLTDCDIETVSFVCIDEYGDEAHGYLSFNDYIDDKWTIEELVTVSNICDGLQIIADSAKDEIMKDFVDDRLMVCREVDYDNLTDRIIFGEDKLSELMSRIFGIDCAIHKFYYKIENMLINNGSVCKARYYISTEKLDDSYKLHPAFIEEDQHYPLQFVSTDMIKGDDNEIVTNKSFKEFKDSIHGNVKMWNVEIVSALQLLALVELGFKEANNENTTGKDFHGIKNLFNGKFQFVDGLTIKGDEIKVNGNTVCKTPTIVGGYIRYFKNLPDYDWLFIPNQTTDNDICSIGCWVCILNTTTSEYVARFGGGWASSTHAGFFYWNLYSGSFYSDESIGSRTMID